MPNPEQRLEELRAIAKEIRDRDFNPNSFNAQFAVVLTRLGDQDKKLEAILLQTTATNGRVTKLESVRAQAFAWIAGASFVLVLIFEILRFIFKA